MSALGCKELAKRLNVRLQRLEADEEFNKPRGEERCRPLFHCGAQAEGGRVHVWYVTYHRCPTVLLPERAAGYLAWLDAGNKGTHNAWELEIERGFTDEVGEAAKVWCPDCGQLVKAWSASHWGNRALWSLLAHDGTAGRPCSRDACADYGLIKAGRILVSFRCGLLLGFGGGRPNAARRKLRPCVAACGAETLSGGLCWRCADRLRRFDGLVSDFEDARALAAEVKRRQRVGLPAESPLSRVPDPERGRAWEALCALLVSLAPPGLADPTPHTELLSQRYGGVDVALSDAEADLVRYLCRRIDGAAGRATAVGFGEGTASLALLVDGRITPDDLAERQARAKRLAEQPVDDELPAPTTRGDGPC